MSFVSFSCPFFSACAWPFFPPSFPPSPPTRRRRAVQITPLLVLERLVLVLLVLLVLVIVRGATCRKVRRVTCPSAVGRFPEWERGRKGGMKGRKQSSKHDGTHLTPPHTHPCASQGTSSSPPPSLPSSTHPLSLIRTEMRPVAGRIDTSPLLLLLLTTAADPALLLLLLHKPPHRRERPSVRCRVGPCRGRGGTLAGAIREGAKRQLENVRHENSHPDPLSYRRGPG